MRGAGRVQPVIATILDPGNRPRDRSRSGGQDRPHERYAAGAAPHRRGDSGRQRVCIGVYVGARHVQHAGTTETSETVGRTSCSGELSPVRRSTEMISNSCSNPNRRVWSRASMRTCCQRPKRGGLGGRALRYRLQTPEAVMSTCSATSFQVRLGRGAPGSASWRRDLREHRSNAWRCRNAGAARWWCSNERPARHRSGAASSPARTSRLHVTSTAQPYRRPGPLGPELDHHIRNPPFPSNAWSLPRQREA